MATVSVGMLVTNRERLMMVRHRPNENGVSQWGVPAGGVEMETVSDAIKREFHEETNLDPRFLSMTSYERQTPRVNIVVSENRLQVGINYSMEYVGWKLPKDGWEVKGDTTVTYAKMMVPRDLCRMVEKRQTEIFKPQFNIPAMLWWLLDNSATNGFWTRIVGKVDGVSVSRYGDIRYNPQATEIMPELLDSHEAYMMKRRDKKKNGTS